MEKIKFIDLLQVLSNYRFELKVWRKGKVDEDFLYHDWRVFHLGDNRYDNYIVGRIEGGTIVNPEGSINHSTEVMPLLIVHISED